MQVHLGWSGEAANGQWVKFDVTVDETDLRRVLARAGIPEDTKATTKDAYVLLSTEADILLLTTRMRHTGLSAEDAHAELEPLVKRRETHLDLIRETVAA